MKKLLISTLSVSIMLVSLLISGVVYAADDAHFIVGEKYGTTRFTTSRIGDLFEDTHGNSILFGYDFGTGLALQLELLRANGDLSPKGGNGNYGVKTRALYLAYRTPGKFYFLVKGGYLSEQISMDSGTTTSSNSDSGLSAGLGLGYNFGRVSLETEYTKLEKNLDFLSLGVNFNF